MCDTIYLTLVTGPHLLVAFQHGGDLHAILFAFNIGEVVYVAPIFCGFGRTLLSIDDTILGGDN